MAEPASQNRSDLRKKDQVARLIAESRLGCIVIRIFLRAFVDPVKWVIANIGVVSEVSQFVDELVQELRSPGHKSAWAADQNPSGNGQQRGGLAPSGNVC